MLGGRRSFHTGREVSMGQREGERVRDGGLVFPEPLDGDAIP
jgi:hypothetical protein